MVSKASGVGADFVWREHDRPEEIGRTVWSIFPADTDYFGASRPSFMVNYRVSNLDRMLAQLRGQGVTVEKVENYDYGRFAWIHRPGRQPHRIVGAEEVAVVGACLDYQLFRLRIKLRRDRAETK